MTSLTDQNTPTKITSRHNNAAERSPTQHPRTGAKGKADGKAPAPQNTHFICFPLTTEESVAQLSKSLEYFRSRTLAPDAAVPTKSGKHSSQKSTRDIEDQKARERLRRQLQGESAADALAPSTGSEESPASRPRREDGSLESASGTREVSDEQDPLLRVIPYQAYRPPGTFHLTLGMLDLSDPAREAAAHELLHSIDFVAMLREAEAGDKIAPSPKSATRTSNTSAPPDTSSLGSASPMAPESLTRPISPPPSRTSGLSSSASPLQPLAITLHSLGTFPRPAASRVFYARPHDATGRLARFANLVRARFEADLGLTDSGRSLTLHATVANMIYVRGRRGGRAGEVDAREVIRVFGGEVRGRPFDGSAKEQPTESGLDGIVWAEDVVIDRVRICRMGAVRSERPGWGMEYEAIAEEAFAGLDSKAGADEERVE